MDTGAYELTWTTTAGINLTVHPSQTGGGQ